MKIDFDFELDLTPYIASHWCRMAVIPSDEVNISEKMLTLRALFEQYTCSKKCFKEIKCEKQLIGWDWREMKKQMKQLIYSSGYEHEISVVSKKQNHEYHLELHFYFLLADIFFN